MLNIRIFSRKAAQVILAEDKEVGNIKAMISISDSEPYLEKAPYGTARVSRVLRLIFDDSIDPNSSYQPPTRKDVQQIINFAKLLQTEQVQGDLLVHCEAGISRSSSAAIICLTTWNGAGSEMATITRIYQINPQAFPNSLMIRYADELLDRKGALIDALRGAPDAGVWHMAHTGINTWK